MTLLEFGQRAFDHDGSSFNGAAVQLTGFVAGAEENGFKLARYTIACCAADAAPVVVHVVGTVGDPSPRDQWVRVTGTFRHGVGGLTGARRHERGRDLRARRPLRVTSAPAPAGEARGARPRG
jgi:uncharacterized repeat protein (TIGR03943 family)